MRLTVGHFEIPAHDIERAARFVREALGWEATSAPWSGGAYLRLTPPETGEAAIRGGLLPAGSVADGQPLLVLHLHEATLEECLAALAEKGAVVEVAPLVVAGAGRFARFRDPEGNRFGIWERC